ncbi:hypothetical protein T09_2490 [Trichinella sp. T9]|nr:hypothetical protein T09_2490 [Trichinella sp. T9]
MNKSDISTCVSRFQPLKSSSTNRAVFNAKQFQDGNMKLADAYKCNQGIRFSISRLPRIEDIMRLSYASSEINAMAQNYIRFIFEKFYFNLTSYLLLSLTNINAFLYRSKSQSMSTRIIANDYTMPENMQVGAEIRRILGSRDGENIFRKPTLSGVLQLDGMI